MSLIWQAGPILDDHQHRIQSSECDSMDSKDIQTDIHALIDKAASLIEMNIRDDSRFLLFEWSTANAELKIVLTDENKSLDSEHIVTCCFTNWETSQHQAEDMAFWIRDYLTTCQNFLDYSLVAAFHSGSRGASQLL